jgi:hypothetical protein
MNVISTSGVVSFIICSIWLAEKFECFMLLRNLLDKEQPQNKPKSQFSYVIDPHLMSGEYLSMIRCRLLSMIRCRLLTINMGFNVENLVFRLLVHHGLGIFCRFQKIIFSNIFASNENYKIIF